MRRAAASALYRGQLAARLLLRGGASAADAGEASCCRFRTAHTSAAASAAAAAGPRADADCDVLVIGGGHNGLVAAAYLAKAGLRVTVLERRHLLGGAAVTEEIVPGFRFSRASYLAGLLRPSIIAELELRRHGLRYLLRDPSSFTPTLPSSRWGGRHLLLGADAAATAASIAQFSAADAEAFDRYEALLGRARELITPLLEAPLPHPLEGGWRSRARSARTLAALATGAARHRDTLVPLYELLTAPAAAILDRWFEGDVLKATLATDSVIGAMTSPRTPGSAYVLLHHVMGSVDGREGVWAYVRGGMGAISDAIASAAREAGAETVTGAEVAEVLWEPAPGGGAPVARGVRLASGERITARAVLANVTPHTLFTRMLPPAALPADFLRHVARADYSCGAFKINCACDALPNFLCAPTPAGGAPGPQHRGTVHFETSIDEIHAAYVEAAAGAPATRPVVEMTIPSALDDTLAPPGQHVVQLFVQFAGGPLAAWAEPAAKEAFVRRVFGIVEEHAPGFTRSVIGYDALSPLDLQTVFGLTGGSIFHGALSLHQLAYARPAPGWASHRTPLRGLYLGGSGAHPGGGVMGAAGRNAATVLLEDWHGGHA